MNILLALVPVSLLLLGAAVWAFLWAVRRGQFDDLDTPPLDILRSDDTPAPPRRDDRDDRGGDGGGD
jgi:cbb3-type cytochrome oxidase maturation protein